MTKRKLISLSAFILFASLTVTGILMYVFPHTTTTASIHTLFGFIFIGIISVHLLNNWKPFKNYLKSKTTSYKFRAIVVLPLVTILIIFGIIKEYPGFNSFYNWGNEFRASQEGISKNDFSYDTVELQTTHASTPLHIEFKKGAHFRYPIYAIWLEDLQGNYLETVFISKSMSTSVFQYGSKTGETWQPDIVRRPEALPRWSHQRGIKAEDGLYIPLTSAPDLDGVTGATIANNGIVKTGTTRSVSRVKLFFEINQSFDWNTYYSKERFPQDPIYSGSGSVGQPALVYSAEIDLAKKGYSLLNLVGHSHHSGKNGKLFSDLTQITTAKTILDRILVNVL